MLIFYKNLIWELNCLFQVALLLMPDPPPPGNGSGPDAPPPPPGTSIDLYIYILGFIALLIAYFFLKNFHKTSSKNLNL